MLVVKRGSGGKSKIANVRSLRTTVSESVQQCSCVRVRTSAQFNSSDMSSNEPVTTLVERASPSPPASPALSEPSDAATPSSSAQERSTYTPEYVPPDQAALAWIDHVQKGGSVPHGPIFVELLQAMLAWRAPFPAPMATLADDLDAKLEIVDTGKKFPHMVDTLNGTLADHEAIWTQCKTKMTHIAVKLKDSKGTPVRGTALQQGGLKLRLTLHKVSDDEAMHDGYNPRRNEGLFRGRAGNAFESTVTMLESMHEFRFQVMLLSSDISGARMYVKVAPVDPQLACNPNLVVQSHSFISRARMPDESFMRREQRGAAATQLLSMATMAETGASSSSPPPEGSSTTETDSHTASPNKRQCIAPESSAALVRAQL